ncbi:PREDICTED: uncharacterized protein LOC104802870 [Tarenaya hassleriana]|uniref:uncharacterized protein LOC104802870 n=1 Tax=Tarenaya hassleriana TaxID=28532 RepID=UPI00053C3FB8|nr:PREDICTED: uncharacterized protein LOC104802870 [Tarenaya hassleriana]
MEEMDLGEWELLSNGFDHDHDEYHDDEDGVMIRNTKRNPNPNAKNLLDMEYFICPSQDPPKQTEPSRRSGVVPTRLLQAPMTWEPIFSTDGTDREDTKLTYDVSVVAPMKILKNPDLGFSENEFVDMKIDPTTVTSPLPQIDLKPLESMDIGSEGEEGDLRIKKESWDGDLIRGKGDQKLNLLKLGLTGIGAICSFGAAAAAATVCVFLSGNNKNQMLRFHIYSDDKRVRRETKLNDAISVMKGVPLVRAQISLRRFYN